MGGCGSWRWREKPLENVGRSGCSECAHLQLGLAPQLSALAGSGSRASRERGRLRGVKRAERLRSRPGVSLYVKSSACVPAPKMAAAAAASGVLGKAGWRFLQLRCLPGEGAAEPGSGEELGWGVRSAWPGWGAEEAVVAAREQGEMKDIGAESPAFRA